jgi:hypothetical protein
MKRYCYRPLLQCPCSDSCLVALACVNWSYVYKNLWYCTYPCHFYPFPLVYSTSTVTVCLLVVLMLYYFIVITDHMGCRWANVTAFILTLSGTRLPTWGFFSEGSSYDSLDKVITLSLYSSSFSLLKTSFCLLSASTCCHSSDVSSCSCLAKLMSTIRLIIFLVSFPIFCVQ